MKFFKDENNSVFAYTDEQLALVAALNRAELVPAMPNYEHDKSEKPVIKFDAVVYAMRAKIASMTEITEDEAMELTQPPAPPRDEKAEIQARLSEINAEMMYLQDAVDLEIATEEEKAQLLALKRERVELKRRLQEMDAEEQLYKIDTEQPIMVRMK